MLYIIIINSALSDF